MHWDTILGLSNLPFDLHLPPLVIGTTELNVVVTGDVTREFCLLVVAAVGDVVVVFSGVQSPASIPLLPADGMSPRGAFWPALAG